MNYFPRSFAASGFVDGSLRYTRTTPVCKEVTVRAHRENVPSIRFFIHLYARPGQRPFTSRRGGGGNINFKIFCRPFPRSTLAPFFFPFGFHSHNPDTDKSGSEEELAAGRPGH